MEGIFYFVCQNCKTGAMLETLARRGSKIICHKCGLVMKADVLEAFKPRE